MRLQAALVGDLEAAMEREIREAEIAVTESIAEASDGLKAELRGQVVGAGLGERLSKTWRGQLYPRGRQSVSAAALVYSKAPELMDVFNTGALIRSRSGFFLPIPTPLAGAVRGAGFQPRLTPGLWEKRTGMRLRFVYRRGAPSLLVADNARIDGKGRAKANTGRRNGATFTRLKGRTTAVIFVLHPQARLRKRLDIKRAAEHWQGRLPGMVLRRWR